MKKVEKRVYHNLEMYQVHIETEIHNIDTIRAKTCVFMYKICVHKIQIIKGNVLIT